MDTTQGPKRTRQRQTILSALEDGKDSFLTAQEIHRRLQAGGHRLGLTTVYRTLNLMSETHAVDVVRLSDGEQAFRKCELDAHHHHLVCRRCGAADEIQSGSLERWLAQEADKRSFVDVTHDLNVFGVCSECSASAR